MTNRGGRTCHAAIIARELGIPAVVGCGDATELLSTGVDVTVSCAEGDTGHIYAGILNYDYRVTSVDEMPELPFKIMMNVGNPDRAFDFQRLPHAGIGLARLEFIINRMIGVHPRALMDYDTLPADLKEEISEQIGGYASPTDFYVEKLVEGIATLGASFAPERVIVRLSDFKSNEYRNFDRWTVVRAGGRESDARIPRCTALHSESFRPCFEFECRALKEGA